MRPHIYGVVCGVSLFVSASLLVAQEVPSGPESASDAATSALDLVRQALQAEVEGSAERRAAWLAEALRVDPDCRPGRGPTC